MLVTTQATVDIPRPQAAVFETFIQDRALSTYCRKLGPFAAIESAQTHGELRAGASRTVTMSDGMVLRETIFEHEPPTVHAYGWSDPPMPLGALIERAEGRWEFDESHGRTRVVWRYAFTLRSRVFFGVGKAVAFGFRMWMQQALDRGALALLTAEPDQATS